MPDVTLTPSTAVVTVSTSHLDEGITPRDWYAYGVAMQGTDLAERFRVALKKLEGMLYAVCGAIPASYKNGEQWWLHQNPRCLWPEQVWYATTSPNITGDWRVYYPQPAAEGQIGGPDRGTQHDIGQTGYFDWSRSDSHGRQYRRTKHDEVFFPWDSVIRTPSASELEDPTSAATVTITWVSPEPIRSLVDTVHLYYKVNSGSVSNAAMTSSDGGVSYAYTLAAQANDAQVLYYVRVVTNETTPRTLFDPYGAAANDPPTLANIPADEADAMPGTGHNKQVSGTSYYWKVCDHTHPYSHGLPELIHEDYTGAKAAGLKRCTGTWRFESWTTIKPALVNLARFALDALGDTFHHDPADRGSFFACCLDHHIRFRWTGGNRPWIYRKGGKSPGGVTPLHNLTGGGAGTGSATVRRTWRGGPSPFEEEDTFAGEQASHEYGDDESWLSWPRYSTYLYRGSIGDIDDEWYPGIFRTHGKDRGLREGDQLDPVHLEEIIAAVDYLIASGLWWPRELETCKRTPTSCRPWVDAGGETPLPNPAADYYRINKEGIGWDGGFYGAVCLHGPGCYAVNPACDAAYPFEVITPGEPYEAPANIAACRAGTGTNVAAGVCYRSVYWWWNQPQFLTEPGYEDVLDEFSAICVARQSAALSDGYTWYLSCQTPSPEYELSATDYVSGKSLGHSYFLCGPSRVENNVGSTLYGGTGNAMWSAQDTLHGNGYAKTRIGGRGVDAGPWEDTRGPQGTRSMGNRADAARACGSTNGDDTVALGWDTVTAVETPGATAEWISSMVAPGTLCHPDSIEDAPPLPGLGWYGPPDTLGVRSPLCTLSLSGDYSSVYNTTPEDAISCVFDPPTFPYCCLGAAVNAYAWLRVELNLSGGVPQLYDYELSPRMLVDGGGQVVPTVYPDTPWEPDDSGWQTTLPYVVTIEPDCLITADGVQCPFDTWVID